MTAFLDQLPITQPDGGDVCMVFFQHQPANSYAWALVRGDQILNWDGSYSSSRAYGFKPLGSLSADVVEHTALTQLKGALAATCTPIGMELLDFVAVRGAVSDWVLDERERALLQASAIVSYVVLGNIDLAACKRSYEEYLAATADDEDIEQVQASQSA